MEQTGIRLETMCLSAIEPIRWAVPMPAHASAVFDHAPGDRPSVDRESGSPAGRYDTYLIHRTIPRGSGLPRPASKRQPGQPGGCHLAFETMETAFMNTVGKAMAYVDRIQSPYLQVYPDSAT
jgi:hypothetical protein